MAPHYVFKCVYYLARVCKVGMPYRCLWEHLQAWHKVFFCFAQRAGVCGVGSHHSGGDWQACPAVHV